MPALSSSGATPTSKYGERETDGDPVGQSAPQPNRDRHGCDDDPGQQERDADDMQAESWEKPMATKLAATRPITNQSSRRTRPNVQPVRAGGVGGGNRGLRRED